MTTTQTTTAACGKCDGRGTLWFWGHRDNGRCYACAGSGQVTAQSRTVVQLARLQAAHTLATFADADYCGEVVTRAVWARNPVYWAAMAKRAAECLLVVADTAWARKQLARLDPYARAEIIRIGRELKAGKAA
jgi:hypothetical protein